MAYKFIYILGDWDSARKTCIEHNSTLAVIDSDTKKDYAGRLVNYSQISAWVGIHRLSGSSDWVSIKTGKERTNSSDHRDKIPFLSRSTGASDTVVIEWERLWYGRT